MYPRFIANVRKKNLFDEKDQLLLAVSAGVDSTVLAHLLYRMGCSFSLVHCNFKLRGDDSDNDEKFCRNLATRLNVEFFSKSFDISSKTAEGMSIQMSARELRYQWFSELLQQADARYVLTAHHSGDVVETMLLNLLRGTGSNGLKGIAEKQKHLIRPLVGFNRQEIESYAKDNNIEFRDDRSNNEDKYKRNFLRLNIVPLLRGIAPDLEKTFEENAVRFSEESGIVNQFIYQKAKEIVSHQEELILIDKNKLLQEPCRSPAPECFSCEIVMF